MTLASSLEIRGQATSLWGTGSFYNWCSGSHTCTSAFCEKSRVESGAVKSLRPSSLQAWTSTNLTRKHQALPSHCDISPGLSQPYMTEPHRKVLHAITTQNRRVTDRHPAPPSTFCPLCQGALNRERHIHQSLVVRDASANTGILDTWTMGHTLNTGPAQLLILPNTPQRAFGHPRSLCDHALSTDSINHRSKNTQEIKLHLCWTGKKHFSCHFSLNNRV